MTETRCTEEMKLWLFDLVHGNLLGYQIMQGFVKHYVLNDMGIADVQRDIHFHTSYSREQMMCGISELKKVLGDFAEQGEIR